MSEPPTHAVVQTPAGRGAIAVVLVAGPRAVSAVDDCFRAANNKRLEQQAINRVCFGRWSRSGDGVGEELIVCRTGADRVEVHCHGGDAATRAVLSDLAGHGCVRREWREHLLAANADPVEQEARTALAECVTDRTAAILLDQLNGALREAVLETVESIEAGRGGLSLVDRLIDRGRIGRGLTRAWRVVLAGPPNVGKSSLINALVGYDRAIVFDRPGVTRDVVTAAAAVDGWPVELADTAGLRSANDPVEATGVELGRAAAAEADVLVLVEAWGAGDATGPGAVAAEALFAELGLAPLRSDQRLIRVGNKADLAERAVGADSDPGLLAVSATSGANLPGLVSAISAAIAPEPPPAGAAVPFTARHFELLSRARIDLVAGNEPSAVEALLAMLSPGGR